MTQTFFGQLWTDPDVLWNWSADVFVNTFAHTVSRNTSGCAGLTVVGTVLPPSWLVPSQGQIN